MDKVIEWPNFFDMYEIDPLDRYFWTYHDLEITIRDALDETI